MEIVQREGGNNRHREASRDYYKIVKDMLQIVTSKYCCNKTEIAYGAGLTHSQQKRYMAILVDRGLILLSSGENSPKVYEISDLGRRYLQLFAELEDDLRPMSGHSRTFER